MATYTPKVLIQGAITATPTAYVSPAGGFGVIRTILATPTTTSITLTVALGTDAAGTRVIAGVALTNAVPYVLNGWIITPTNNAHAIDVTSNATGTQLICNISGYEYA